MLRGVERRLRDDSQLETAYRDFLAEYEALEHMEEAPQAPRDGAVFLPHHPVVKRNVDGAPRVRVVFNATSPTSNGLSLNDQLLTGRKLQRDIFSVLLRWRVPRFALKADIEKMFRQIRVHEEDADLQRILWRRGPDQEPREFRLTTVTYGTACAPYLAQRVLLRLAEDEGAHFPRARAIMRSNFYVDDVLFGADGMEETIACRDELTRLLGRGGFSFLVVYKYWNNFTLNIKFIQCAAQPNGFFRP
ncbi:uncharacterized protein LOC143260479 [Megalopta genalis]|uniref:uncharacterized protein LOC143260479 n=1 Tax=Megalopta genalis TaxID=115081 RepID=UPI003FD0FF0F